MKQSKLALMTWLLGALTLPSPQPSRAGGGPSGFFDPPFGKLTLNIHVFEQNFSTPIHDTWIDTRGVMLMVLDAINNNEKASYALPPGAYLWFDGSDVLLRRGDGTTFLDLSDS